MRFMISPLNLVDEKVLKEIEKKVKIIDVIGKGHRGIVFKGIYKGKLVAVKVMRKDSPKNTIRHEAEILKMLEEYKFSPKVYFYSDIYLVMEYINGVELKKIINSLSKEEILKVVEQILKISLRLDSLGIEHGEIQGGRHFLVAKDRVYIIDFDKSRVKRTTKNFTSAISLLFGDNLIANRVKEALNLEEEDILFIRRLAKLYKRSGNYGTKS
ncbi:protein kinase domain-containing protein [Methanocaldococcus infernus]|uniref:protein kinase domain-containing protein n=1 Tax=Methanocaldococcus infernus TaxID=67760 RepID=UPI00064EA630|nr:protein kinase [Methanocaldococcus infernus]